MILVQHLCHQVMHLVLKRIQTLIPSASFATEYLLRVLMTHPTYQRVLNEYLQPEEAGSQLANGKAVNNNGKVHNGNGSLHYNKKFE